MKRIIVDLITGFLGAGKTTFIHKYIQYLKEQGELVSIIENEFGDAGIDSELLKNENCDIQDLSGLCMCCVGKQELISILKNNSRSVCDRIIIEPSGIYDVDEFFEVMSLPEIQEACEIGSIISIVDPNLDPKISEEVKYLMFTQILASGVVILSKTQEYSDQRIGEAINLLNTMMIDYKCEIGVPGIVINKPWDHFTDDDFEEVIEAGYFRFVHDREEFSHPEIFQSLNIKLAFENEEELKKLIIEVFESTECGKVYRIKGFCKSSIGKGYEINCTADTINVKRVDVYDEMLVAIGQKIKRKGFKALGISCELT